LRPRESVGEELKMGVHVYPCGESVEYREYSECSEYSEYSA
jgi:hypothetical protein